MSDETVYEVTEVQSEDQSVVVRKYNVKKIAFVAAALTAATAATVLIVKYATRDKTQSADHFEISYDSEPVVTPDAS
jgi:hypothetical protein